VKGFDGDPSRAAALRAALVGLLDVFPQHLPKPRHPTWLEPDELARNEQFAAILRAHKKDRLAIPIEALRATGAPYHGFDRLHPRRLAWFVPSLLASWLDGAPSRSRGVFGAGEIEEIVEDVSDDDWEWTTEESEALDGFFVIALDAALASPLRPVREPAVERPLEDGVRVWSLHSPSVALDVLRVATALRVPIEPLIDRWTSDPTPLALDHLLEAVFDTIIPAKHWLSWEPVADRLGEAFFDATGARQERLSKAEATVRRNIARRADD
jgi:hypothetical protein